MSLFRILFSLLALAVVVTGIIFKLNDMEGGQTITLIGMGLCLVSLGISVARSRRRL